MGQGAADLGVAGQVTEAQMKALFGRGEHPDADAIASEVGASGAPPEVVRQAVRLGRRYPEYEAPGRQAVAGYDLVFTPVKSASVLWALGPPDIRVAVEAAHHEAVADAIAFLEANAAFTRVGDPDLHTHVAVSNKVRTREDGPDGRPRWRALDGRALYAVGVAASERYNTRFEDALARRLGVRFTARADTVAAGKRPVREIVGVPDVLMRHFSSRRAAIEERYAELARKYRTEHGHEPSRSAQLKLAERASLETREGKPPPKAFGAQLGEWRAAAERVAGPGVAERLVACSTGRDVGSIRVDDVDVAALARWVIAVMEDERSTWSRWNLVAEVERQTRALRCATPGARDRLARAVVAEASDARNAVRITPPVAALPPLHQPLDDAGPKCRAQARDAALC